MLGKLEKILVFAQQNNGFSSQMFLKHIERMP